MKKNDSSSISFVSVPPNFWPLFFTDNLVRQFVGETVCFGLCDQMRKTQLIVMIPAIGAKQFPSMEEISRHFPAYAEGRPYRDPGELPVSIDDLAAVTAFELSKFVDEKSTIYLLVPHWDNVVHSRTQDLHYLRFEKMDDQSVATILEAVDDEEVIFSLYDKETNEFRLILSVVGKFELTVNGGTSILRTSRGDFIIRTSIRSATTDGGSTISPIGSSNLFFLPFAGLGGKQKIEA